MPNLQLRGRAQQLHGPLPFCCCQRFPGPEFFIIKKGRQSPKEGCGTNRPSSAWFLFDEKTNSPSFVEPGVWDGMNVAFFRRGKKHMIGRKKSLWKRQGWQKEEGGSCVALQKGPQASLGFIPPAP
jgi:hypothetical protein